MLSHPLIKDYTPERPLLWLLGKPVTQAEMLGAAVALARTLPDAQYLLNVCESRYGFIIGFVAGLLARRTTLLAPNRLPATLKEIQHRYPDSALLADSEISSDSAVRIPQRPEGAAWQQAVPLVDAAHIAAVAFTSGSTGTPQPHPKNWNNLVLTAGYAAERLQTAGRCITGTVPPQHMYGLETTVMPALAGNAIVSCERPLFPEDLRQALAATPGPRMLITTPVHLNAFLQAGLRYPAVERIVSATAPLSQPLCEGAERHFGGRVDEIYGCTEAGSVATRRMLEGELWTPYHNIGVSDCDEGAIVCGPHLDAPVRLTDIIRIEMDGRFRLLGRSSDMVKVAGKRASLQDLTQRLLALPGVEDGVIFMPQPDAETARPAALVVAPTRTENELLDALAQQIDAAFLPRPLRKVERLPRNAVGKLPLATLIAFLR